MKRRQFLVAAGSAGLLTACSGKFNLNSIGDGESSELALFTVETIAVPLGYYAGQSEVADLSLRSIYDLATKGTLTTESVNHILKTLGASDPIAVLLVKRALRLAELAGASVEGGSIIDLAGLDPKVVEAIARGYVEGFDTYKLTSA